jgi:rhodanese-related sulfurtransferase
MKFTHKIITGLMISALAATAIYASPEPTNEKHKTVVGKYLSAVETVAFMKENAKNTIFIDVRSPEEIEYVGYSYLMDTNIPLSFNDISKWDEKKKRYAGVDNKNFVSEVEAAIKAKGLNKDANIVFMCRSGDRSAVAVNKMVEAGYKNAYTVEEGFEGQFSKPEYHRTLDGWKNNAPKDTWGYKLEKEKMYLK